MPRGFYVKVSPSQSFRAITNFFVKVSQSSWVSVSDAWVKVSPSLWQPFYSAGTEPASPIEILTTFNSSDEIRLQGVNYRWSPSPTTLQYRFRVVNKEAPSSFYDLTSLTTTTNPSAGTSITLPSSSTYNTITKSSGNYFQGATNVFQFLVRATTASGNVVEKKAEYEFRIPAAPTLTIETLTSSSVRLTITAASQADFNATYRYIVYRYDSTSGFVYGVSGVNNGLGGGGASTYTVTRDITGLTPGRQYTFYVMPITGSTGIDTTTHSGYPGVTANIQNTPTSADPGPFTTISFTKGFPNSSAQGVVRATQLEWNASENATRYEIQYQAKALSTDAWTTVQTFTASPYDTDTSQSMQWGSPKPTGGFDYYSFMRASIRASNPDSTTVTYSDGGTASTPVYIEASGSAPAAPSFGTITKDSSTASVPVTISTNTGSNFLYTTLEYMTRKSTASYGSTWSTTTISNNAATVSLSGLDASSTYYIKVRVRNYDDLYAEAETSFETTTAVTTPNSLSATTTDSTKITLSWSGGSADDYLLYWLTSSTSYPAQSYTGFDFTDTASPYEWGNGTPTTPQRGVDYYFFIRARRGTSPNYTYGSNWYPAQTTGIKGRAPLYAPGTPSSFQATSVKSDRASFSWSAPSTSTTQDAHASYDIYYTTSTTAPNANTTPSTTATGISTTATISNLSQDTTYYFYIRAINADAKSAWSGAVQIKTRLTTPVLSHSKRYVYNNDLANTLTRVTSSQKRQDWSYSARVWYDLSWGANSSATSYEIFWNTSTTAPADDDAADYTASGNAYSDYWDQSNRSTVTYYYWVRSKNSNNTSEWSNSTGGISTATSVSGLSITLVNNTSGATSSASPGNSALTYLWTGVSTTALHYSRISASIAGTSTGTIRSSGAV